MTPLNVIIWTCVAVFAATPGITLLHLTGRVVRLPPRVAATLVRILIVQTVTAGVDTFSYSL